MSTKLFVLYDARAANGETEDATVFVTAHSWGEAVRDSADFLEQGAVWFEYKVVGNNQLINGKMRPCIMRDAEKAGRAKP